MSEENSSQSASNGSSINGPVSAVDGGPSPNPRSCVTCRRRKVKCDKKNPCSHCVRAKIECIFPGPGRAPRKRRKPPDVELLDRLRRLEGVVSSLNAQVGEHEQEAADREKRRMGGAREGACSYANGILTVAADNSVEDLETRFGRLVVGKGRSRYITNSFWTSLNNEVEDLKAILIESSDDEEDVPSPESSSASQFQGFVFGYSSSNMDMQQVHPSEIHARQFWEVFKENVDPLVKVLHIPTFESTFNQAVSQFNKVNKSLEPMLFVIYYGAVTSTSPAECREKWGEERTALLTRYRFGIEQSLARANFLYCEQIVVLQAFVVFLILLRRNDDARKIWTLTGLVLRSAQTLGIHRDGSHFDLQPFEIEMRRRLWWQVCVLDARSSEDHGCGPTIVEASFDTKMPLNVNDADLHPDMTEHPEDRQGFTEMTFCLLRFEVANIFRRMHYIPPGPNRCTEHFASLTITEKEKWVTNCHQVMKEKYLQNCDMSIPLCWVTATISRLIMSKMWLIVYHPHQRKDGGATLPQETKDKLFITSLENIEYSILLETEARTMKWGWLFRTFVQWHAIAFLLAELCVRTRGAAVERAWRALEATAGRWLFPVDDTWPLRKRQEGCLWNPLRKLLTKAKAARAKEVALERASLATRNGQNTYYPQGLGQTSSPSARANQPSSEELDRMLRPAAPRLGEVPAARQPSWPDSPSMAKASPSYSDRALTDSKESAEGRQRQQQSTMSNDSPRNGHNLGQHVKELSTFGLDSVMADVMEYFDFEGNPTSIYHNYNAFIPQAPEPTLIQQRRAPSPQAFAKPTGMESSNDTPLPTFNDGMFVHAGIGFSTIPTTTPALDNMGQQTDSPTMDSGNIDWALWDDMVN